MYLSLAERNTACEIRGMPPLSCVFFDAAGTLIRLREPVGVTYARIAGHHGIKVDSQLVETRFRQAWKATPPLLHPEGSPSTDDDASWWRELVAKTFAHATGAPLPNDVLHPLFEELYHHFAQPGVWTLFDDALPALELLRPNHRLFVLSNFDRRLVTILDGLGVTAFFDQIILSSEVGASKPHPRMFAYALRAANVPPDQCLHIGDDRKCDLEGAQIAGMHSRLVDRPTVTLLSLANEIKESAKK
jgi:putative hydrolase of the HAD superfamily